MNITVLIIILVLFVLNMCGLAWFNIDYKKGKQDWYTWIVVLFNILLSFAGVTYLVMKLYTWLKNKIKK